MNLMLQLLSEEEIESRSKSKGRIAIEDNVGEAIHIHIGDVRLEMSVKEFMAFSSEMRSAAEVLQDGNR